MGHGNEGADLERDAVRTAGRHVEIELAVAGRQAAHAESAFFRNPCPGQPGSEDHFLGSLALARDHGGQREHVFRGDPGVRHVAEMAGRARVAPGDFRPLVPSERTPVGEEERQQLMGFLAFPDADKGTDDADLVGGVVQPGHLAAVLPAEAFEVGVEHLIERAGRKIVGEVELGDGIGSGGGIEVRPLDRARDVAELFLGDHPLHGPQHVTEKFRRFLVPALRLALESHGQRQFRGGLESADAPEVVPVGMHRMRQVALVAGRLGQQAEESGLPDFPVFAGRPLRAEQQQILRGFADTRPHGFEKFLPATVADNFADTPEELAVAVVLHQRIHAVAVDHARDRAVRALELRIPAEEFAQHLGAVRFGQRGAHDHAVPDPRAGVAPRPRLDGRTVAVNQNMAGRGAEACKRLGGTGRGVPHHRRKDFLPAGDGKLPALVLEFPGFSEERHRHRHPEQARILRHRPDHDRGGQPGLVVERITGRHLAPGEKLQHAALLEGRSAVILHRAVCADPPAVDAQARDVADDPVDGTAPAEIAECLPRRIHLIGPDGYRQAGLLAGIRHDLIGRPQDQRVAAAIDPRHHPQLDAVRLPGHFREGDAIGRQRDLGFHVRPGHELVAR